MMFVHAAVSMNPSPGVVSQMAQEADAARQLGLDWEVLLVKGGGQPKASITRKLLRYIGLRLAFGFALARRSSQGQQILVRHAAGDAFQFIFSFFWGPYVTVHHTLEEAEFAQHRGVIMRVLSAIERTLGRSVVRRARGLVCMTQEIADHERERARRPDLPVFIYPNGVVYDTSGGLPADERDEVPEILFVAGYFYDWHGLDRLLRTLKATAEPFVLHLVGQLSPELAWMATGDPRIRLHGVLDAGNIAALAARSWLGLSSFALDTKGMTQACTLKVREYLRAGVPVYAGHADSALSADFPYYRHGAADMTELLSYAHAVRHVSRADVSSASQPFIDKRLLLKRLHEQLALATRP